MTLPTLTVELGRLTGWVLGESILGTDTTLAEYEYDDITDRVLSASIRRGRQHELDRIETGTARVSLLNQDGAFNAANTSSVYYPDIRPMVPLRIRAVTSEVPETIAGLVAWYDFSDISTLFQDTAMTSPITADAQTIKAVQDKSGGGFHMTEATNGPLYKTAIQNGQSVSRYDGTNDKLTVAATSGVTNVTLFAVFKILSLVNNRGIVSIYETDGNRDDFNQADMFAISHSATANNARMNTLKSDALNYQLNLGDFATTFAIASLSMTSTDNSLTIYRNGASISPGATNVEARTASVAGVIVGARWEGDPAAPANFGNDDIGEVILYNSALSVADHNLVGEYLADKWGLTWTTI